MDSFVCKAEHFVDNIVSYLKKKKRREKKIQSVQGILLGFHLISHLLNSGTLMTQKRMESAHDFHILSTTSQKDETAYYVQCRGLA